MNRVLILLSAAIACTAATPSGVTTLAPNAFPVQVPSGRACSDVLDPPGGDDTAHVETLAEIDNVTTDPPTSGKHFGEWAEARIYSDPVHDGNQIHNLEHGHVVIQYRDIPDEQIGAIKAVVEADPRMVLMAPRPTMPWVLALTSWGKIQVCKVSPPDAGGMVRAFVTGNRDNAPESIP